MASTLIATVDLRDRDLNYTISGKQTDTTTGSDQDRRTLEIGTSEEEHTIISDITGGAGPGWCFIKNNDSTNYVQVGILTTSYFARLAAGDSMLLKLDSGVGSLFLKANTAACDVTIDIRER